MLIQTSPALGPALEVYLLKLIPAPLRYRNSLWLGIAIMQVRYLRCCKTVLLDIWANRVLHISFCVALMVLSSWEVIYVRALLKPFRKGNDELSLNIISGSFFFGSSFFGSLVLAWAAFHAIKAHVCGCLCYFVREPLIAFRCNRSWQSLSFSVPKLVRQKSKSFGRQASHLQLGMRANLGCVLLWETSRVVRPKFGLWFRLWRISINDRFTSFVVNGWHRLLLEGFVGPRYYCISCR